MTADTIPEPFTIPERVDVGEIGRRFGMRWPTGTVPPKRSLVVRLSKRIVRMRDSGTTPYYSDLSQTFRWGVRFNYQGDPNR
ncbi:hypothetical protein RND64_20210 [Gordonia sp. w5E2]|uniref:hypothetical protein n=1 Tax=Gordonia sp. w5E2 TaxID=3075837 RepID=UPI002F42E138